MEVIMTVEPATRSVIQFNSNANESCPICYSRFDEEQQLIPGLPFFAAKSPILETLCCSSADHIRCVHEVCLSQWADTSRSSTINQAALYGREKPLDENISFSCINCNRPIKWIDVQALIREIPQSNFERTILTIRSICEQNFPLNNAAIRKRLVKHSLALLLLSTYSFAIKVPHLAYIARFAYKLFFANSAVWLSLKGIEKQRELASFLEKAVDRPIESLMGLTAGLYFLLVLMQCFEEFDHAFHCYPPFLSTYALGSKSINSDNCRAAFENLSNLESIKPFLQLLFVISTVIYGLNGVKKLAIKYPRQTQMLVNASRFIGSGVHVASGFVLKKTFKVLGAFSSKTISLVGTASKFYIAHVDKITLGVNSVVIAKAVSQGALVLGSKIDNMFQCVMGTELENYWCNKRIEYYEKDLISEIQDSINVIIAVTAMFFAVTFLRLFIK